MGQKLDSFPSNISRKYEYEKWLDGCVWKLDKGVDFTVSAKSFRMMIRHVAVNRGLGIKTRVVNDSVIIQVFQKGASNVDGINQENSD